MTKWQPPEPEALGRDYNKGWDGVDAYGYTEDQAREIRRAALEEAAVLTHQTLLHRLAIDDLDIPKAIRKLKEKHMTPSNELRFVERMVYLNLNANSVSTIKVLQQKWENGNAPIGFKEEWRDVPLVRETL